MKEGDILLIKSKRCPISWLIRKFIKSNFNHVAWALDNKTLLEVKSVKGIVSTPVKYYKNKFLYRTKLLRIKNISKYRLQKALHYAVIESATNEDKGYFKFLLNLLLLARKQENLSKPTCSGFIAEALNYVGWHFTEDKHKHPFEITPEDINQSRRVKEVSSEF